jgi:hypothetical protein
LHLIALLNADTREMSQVIIKLDLRDREKKNKLQKSKNARCGDLFDRGLAQKNLCPYCGIPKNEGYTQSFSNDPKIKLVANIFSYNFSSQGSPQIRVSC